MAANIAHVVVLMLENRSFDSMLGRLYKAGPDFEGVTDENSNEWNGQNYKAWSSPGPLTPQIASIPTPDPNELFVDMTEQIFGAGNSPPSPPTMGGFVSNYMRTTTNNPQAVMHGFEPEQIPVLSGLAKAFGVSDRWHASAPNQTWPNRFFAHMGTATGYVNNSPLHLPFGFETIFNRLTQNHRSWRIYHHDLPQSAALPSIWSELPDHLYSFDDDFMAHAMAGKLPNYTFIEPRYFSEPVVHRMPNDQHPPHDVAYGERLIARCYDALRNGKGWEQTLFIITYDEHGGIYDHVVPPKAVSPDNLHPDGFTFDRYGVRVPAVLVSPWIPAGSIVRPRSGPNPFDHTSILVTLRELFGLGAPFTERDRVAPHLLDWLSLPAPTNGGPRNISLPAVSPSPAELLLAHRAAPNGMQQSLAQLAAQLPNGTANVPAHAAALAVPRPAVKSASVGQASDQAKAGLARFLNPSSDPAVAQAFTMAPVGNSPPSI
jgi:phospholipase C